MKRLSIVLAWLLLLVPALIIGGVALHLLGREQERIERTAAAAAMEHAQAVAENIELALMEVRNELSAALREIPVDELESGLDEWQRRNPLIRNVFIMRLPDQLVLPNPDLPANDEEADFLRRFDALLTGRAEWTEPAVDAVPGQAAAAATAQSRYREARQGLRSLARSGRGKISEYTDTGALPSFGWLSWFDQNQLHVLGWMDQNGFRYGLELEMMALLSRLLQTLPDPAYDDGVLALLDGAGRVMHQRGDATLGPGTPKLASVQIGSTLPNWQVSIYPPAGGFHASGGGAFAIVSALLVALFVAAIVLGGSLLLWQANRNLLDARRKTTFVSNVSHELKTPLTTIRMYAELLGERRVVDPEKQQHYLDVIVNESRRLTRLVNNVLDFSRLEQGRKKYHLEAVDAHALLRDVLDTQEMRIREAGLAMSRGDLDTPLAVHSDRDAIEQVVLNLIDNVIKYAGDGGDLTVESAPGPDTCELRILDRGPGIPAAHRNRIFETFHRVDDSLTTRQPGSGLGLSISRRILRELGGDLEFNQRPGGGSCFVVRIPSSQAEPAEG